MKISEVMRRKPAFCSKANSAQTAARIMLDQGIGILPVVEDVFSAKVVGVVTDRDLCNVVVAHAHNPTQVWVEQCMTPDPIVCEANEEVAKAVRLMREHQLHRLPVVNSKHEIQGIVSITDLVVHEVIEPDELYKLLERISERVCEPKKKVVSWPEPLNSRSLSSPGH